MPTSMPCPSIRIPMELLTPTAFSQFGTVIENPATSPSSKLPIPQRVPPPKHVQANQGSATKYLHVTHMSNLYNLAPSKKPAKAVMNMFVCSPRNLRGNEPGESMPSSWGDLDLDEDEDGNGDYKRQLLDVTILERHPFTTQTFIPIGLSQQDKHTQYLVIVAPTLPASASKRHIGRPPPYPTPVTERKKSFRDIFARARPAPYSTEAIPPPSQFEKLHPSARPKGPGLPDLKNLRAFVATGSQAVTYGAGTWHAPMIVIGDRPVDFVVVQFANDVGVEDCQEVALQSGKLAQEGVVVMVDTDSAGKVQVKAGVGSVKAKL
ncbi:Ureidoglycolate lyase [Ascochyta rabiei]|uniref:Ureidoglycolate hydrolase n=1 Tax=Didymella rabiei TaxID=5454 RepID=A0A163CQV4_DIDRA|nr:Ureidoglycolate lyase [Ascochyta rabiei]KZM22632.1 ureidoglycolate hydrolase [Ascochyta rabiei]UPX19411.1 Ureidoglycolate lyase [Ascochyta rabiei]